MDVMGHETITIEPSPHVDNHVHSNQKTTVNTTIKMNKTPMTPSRLEYSWWSTHWSDVPKYAFVIFTAIVIVVAVLTVYFGSLKPDQVCYLNFKRSVQGTSAGDSHPRQIAVGVFNRDKHLDLVVANSGTDCVGIFMGYGNGIFATQITYSTGLGSRPYSVAVGDFNNDTELDIVVANYGINSVGVLLGHGNGSFTNPIMTSLGSSRPLSIAVEDFNNDKRLDIAVVNYGTLTVAILVGTNDGSFRIDAIYHMGYDSIPYSIAAADVNKDGVLDLAVVNYGTSELVIVLRNRNGSFEIDKYSTGFGSHPVSVDIKDLHNDNTLDIIVANSDTGNVGLFLGYGNGHFTNLTTYSTGSGSRPQSLVISDFNNDTQFDIAVADSSNNNVLVLKGNKNGSFALITTQSTGYNSDPCSMIVGDFDKDDGPDIAIANNGINSILVLTSFHTYPTMTEVNYTTEGNTEPWFVDVSDLNHDNYLDIIVPYYGSNSVGVFINLGNGSFRDQQTYDMGNNSGPAFAAIADFNNDNYSDVIVVLHNVRKLGILLGYGDGTFRHGNIFSMGIGAKPYTASVGDFNSDGNLDFILSDYELGNVGMFFGYGDGTFTNMISLFAENSIYPKCADVADFNNDNILDIAASDNRNSGIKILLGYGNGSFQDPILVSTDGDRPNALTIGDLNGDNLLDIVYSDGMYSHVGVLLGSGNGILGNLTQYSTVHGAYPWYLSLGYYNDDALVDIAVGTSYDASINIFTGIGHGLFKVAIRISTGYNSIPWSVMFADFNNDHQQDLVVANDQTNNILIFFVQNYYADFVSEPGCTTGSVPHSTSVNTVDLDNDGQLDSILVTNAGYDDIEVLRHFDKDNFVNRTLFSTGSHPQSVTTADVNRDHLLDIVVVSSWDNTTNIFLGLKDGSFDEKIVYPTESTPNAIAAGDLNKDGRLDLIIASLDADGVTVFLAHDYVMFIDYTINMTDISSTPIYATTGDFDNDGRLDIAAVSYRCDKPAVYLGYGNGTFSKETANFTVADFTQRSLAIGDLNQDNYLDIVISSSNDDRIEVFLGYGDGSFESPTKYSTGILSSPYWVVVGDFNSDNTLDIVVVNYNDNNVGIFRGYGNGSFTDQKIAYTLPILSGPKWVAVDDLNNDTFLDIVVTNYDANNIYILLGDGHGNFTDSNVLPTGADSGPYSIAIGDLNKDHSLDLIVANQMSQNIGILFGHSNGAFSSQTIDLPNSNSNSNLSSIVVSDINNDTILDILVTDYNYFNSSIGILYGYGDGNFTLPKIYPAGSIAWSPSIAVGDFDNDNRTDLAITHQQQNSISIMLQRKFDPFGSSKLFPTGNHSRPKSIGVGDFNTDDQLDIVVANSGTNNIGILLGDGNGKFSNQLNYPTGSNSQPSALVTADFNNDHCLDIVVVNSATDNIGISLGYGNGTFTNISTYSTGSGSKPSCVAVNDLNQDNHLDVVIATYDTSSVLVFLGKGDGTLSELKQYPLGYGTHPQSVAIGDINNDYLLDIVVVNDGPVYIKILFQTC